MNKTIFVKDKDQEMWQKAEAMVKEFELESMSALIAESLRREIERLETLKALKKEGLERIVENVWDQEAEIQKKVGFYGRCLGNIGDSESIALTEGSKLFYIWEGSYGQEYMVFDSFEELQGSDQVSEGIKSIVANELGEDYIEELRI